MTLFRTSPMENFPGVSSIAKFNYYSHQINKLSNDSKSMWRTLKQVLPSKKNYSSNSDINPEIFNDYFSTIGKHLTEDFGDLVLPQLDISVQTNFSFHEINSNFILNELLKLSLVPKMDFLGFDSKLLHLSSVLIAPLLCHIFKFHEKLVFYIDSDSFYPFIL